MSRPFVILAGLCAMVGAPAFAADLYAGGSFPAMAADKLAQRVGDSLTVVIYETSTASNSAQNTTKKSGLIGGRVSSGTFDKSAQLDMSHNFTGSGETDRSGRIVAQISVVVDGVLPNGDLHVAGEQILKIDGARTNIKLRGRVRREDILSSNTVLSTRLADVSIDYNGTGFVTRSAKPGIVTKVFNFLGLV